MTLSPPHRFGRRQWLWTLGSVGVALSPRLALAQEPVATRGSPLLVCLFLRGAADGLSLVPPFGEAAYHEYRKDLAIAPPGKDGGALDLDGHFGLHPRFEALFSAYQAGELAIVQAVGSPHPTRSHFEAQDYMETAIVGRASGMGWLARCLRRVSPTAKLDPAELGALAFTDEPPVALRGAWPVLTAPSLETVRLRGPKKALPTLSRGFDQMYQGEGLVQRAGREALTLMQRLQTLYRSLDIDESRYPKATRPLSELAGLVKAGLEPSVAWLDVTGWDTHKGQGNAQSGHLSKLIDVWARGLAAFRQDLGAHFERVTVLVMTEFGRTVRANGTGGTDHGHGSVMLLLGGGVRGGRVHGSFPGLGPGQLYQDRDLRITTDFRTVFAEVAAYHFAISDPTVLFPEFAPSAPLGLFQPRPV